jgi:hypothetical protein
MTALGVNAPWAVAFQAAVGKTVRWCRTYGQTQAWSPSSGGFADTIAADARGQYSILSFKSTFTWAQVASGSDDARLTAIANGLVSNGVLPGIIVFNHEPENDAGTAADFKAASGHVKAVMAPLMPGWRFGVCLMVDTFRTGSGRHPDDWVHTSNDVLLVDGYNWRDADTFGGGWADPAVSDRTPASIFGVDINAADYAEALGMAFGFGEIGCSREQADTTGVERTAWWNLFADYILALPPGKVEMICHFEKNTSAVTSGDGGLVNWAIRSEPASAIAFGRPLATSGNGWGDGPWGTMHWGGERPNATYLAQGTITLPAGATAWTVETVVPYGSKLVFPPAASATLTMDNKNLIVYGELEMHPASAAVIQRIQFINVNEAAYVGAPAPTYLGPNMGSMIPSTTDVGLWVMDKGIADLVGTPRAGWNRTGTDPTWLSTDDVRSVPFRVGNYVTFNDHYRNGVLGFYNKFDPVTDTLQSVVGPDGVTYRQEVFNLTRNVIVGGTSGHKAHFLIMTPNVTQVIKFARFEHMGPRKILANGETTLIRGRWAGAHFHHLMDSVGSRQEGCVVLEGTGHSFVMHHSNDVVVYDCITFHTVDDAFWWDNERALIPGMSGDSNSSFGMAADQQSLDVMYDHCAALWTYMPPGEPTSSLVGFLLTPQRSTIQNCVAAGNQGTSSAAGITWPESGSGQWENSNNVVHNNQARGVYIWQNNSGENHVHSLVAFRNGQGGITQGAYNNNYHFKDCVCFENAGSGDVSTDFIHAAVQDSFAAPAYRQVIQDCTFGDYGVIHHVATADGTKVIVRNNHLGHFRIDEFRPPGGKNFRHSEIDYVENDLQEPEDFCNLAHPHGGNHKWIFVMNGVVPSATGDPIPSVLRVQRDDGTAFRLQQVAGSNTDWNPVTIAAFAFSLPPQSLSSAVVGTPYSQQVLMSNPTNLGVAPITWGIASGSGPIPPGMSLSSTGVLSGTPTTQGTYPVTFQATDMSTQMARREVTITIASGAVLQVTTTTVPGGVLGDVYTPVTLTASGGFPPYSAWTVVAGSLPSGLVFSSTGVISGTPTAAGTFGFTVRVTDSVAATAQRAVGITVQDLNPVLVNPSLSPGELTMDYDHTVLVATGGSGGYVFAIVAGALPPGIAVSVDGVIDGIPTVVGDYDFRIRVTDSAGRHVDRDYTIVVYEALSFSPPSFPEGNVNEQYQESIPVIGGAPPISFTGLDGIQPETMPPGLTLTSDGLIQGFPSIEGTFTFDIVVTDGLDATVTQPVTIIIQEGVPTPELPRGQSNAFRLRNPHGGSYMRDKVKT